jgi:hypothetical protein
MPWPDIAVSMYAGHYPVSGCLEIHQAYPVLDCRADLIRAVGDLVGGETAGS